MTIHVNHPNPEYYGKLKAEIRERFERKRQKDKEAEINLASGATETITIASMTLS